MTLRWIETSFFVGLASFALAACTADGDGIAMDSSTDGDASTGDVADTDATDTDDADGGTGSASSDSTTTQGSTCEGEGIVFGRLYVDENGSDESLYAGGFEEGVDSPIPGATVRLFGASDSVQSTETCDDGRYGFPELDPGTYVLAPEHTGDGCSLRNCPRRLPDAIEEGRLNIVTIGDSIPVEGDPVTFPSRLADLFAPVVDVGEGNVAVSGSVSDQWLPGEPYFEDRLRPVIADADVVVISLGGNDVLGFISTVDFSDLAGALAQANETVDQIVSNVRTIASEIRAENADIDIVYCLYVDYSLATRTAPWSSTSFLPDGVVTGLLARAREQITVEDDFVVVDLLEVSQELPMPLDDYLADSLHFNDAGHTLYAYEIFRALGGVLVDELPLGGNRPFDNERSYGYAP